MAAQVYGINCFELGRS